MISLVMPTYNGELYLREQLDSIYNQTLVPDEVIVVDDCSVDNTVSILKEYSKKFGLKYYINEKNLGYNKNFEKAISLCSGDFIALCDQDDIWLPTKIEKCYSTILTFPQDSPALVSSFSSTDINVLNNTTPIKCKSGDWRHCLLQYYSQGCTLFFNRKLKEMVLPIPEGVMYDSYIGMSAALLGNMEYIGEKLMYYRIHQSNSFQKSSKESINSKITSNLNKTIPILNIDSRKNTLIIIRDRFINEANPVHLQYLNKILSLTDTNVYSRIPIIWSFKEIPFLRRIGIVIMLCIKIILNINDK